MREVWRVADVRAAETSLMATLPPGALMSRAAAGLARRCAGLLSERFGGVYGRRVLGVIGAGDNGGDALYAGALLARRGAAVGVLLLDPAKAHAGGLAALRAAGGRVLADLPATADLIIDGIVGIGGRPPLRVPAASVVARMAGVRTGSRGTAGVREAAVHEARARDAEAHDARASGRPIVVAVDTPSGVDVDTGALSGPAVAADVTVTFGCLKPAHVVGPAAPLAGLVDLVDIGLRPWLRASPVLHVADAADVSQWWPRPAPESDKYTRGVVGVVTGSAEYPGAALLSVTGAGAGPSGMIRYAGGAAAMVVGAHPSVVTAPRVAEAGRVQAWVCGSGLGTDERALREVRAVLSAPVPVCLDADALTLISDGRTAATADLLRARSAPLVLTPHDREFARLAGHDVGADRVEAALSLAAKIGAVVLLKGDRTVIAAPDGTAWANPTGTPALATAGSGDVLAGLIGSLLAGGLTPVRAAVAAAFVHGLAGRLASAGSRPATSADAAASLPAAIAAVLGLTASRRGQVTGR